jgi:hypothetical protein
VVHRWYSEVEGGSDDAIHGTSAANGFRPMTDAPAACHGPFLFPLLHHQPP